MAFWKFRSRVAGVAFDLPQQASAALGESIDRFRRDVAKAERRLARARTVRGRRAIEPPPRPRSGSITRPVGHRQTRPRPLRTGLPATVLARRRPRTALSGAGEGIAAALRDRLLALRRGLGRVTRRLGGRTR
jgi:hypothetical protein